MATDKRLDQVSNLTDFDYALIVKGEQVSKISKADLASVVAGLIPTSTIRTKGLMGAGVRVHAGMVTIPAKGSVQLPYKLAGLLMLKNGYSWGGYVMYYGYKDTLSILGTPSSFTPISGITINEGVITVSTTASENRQYRYVILNMTDPNDNAEYLQD